MRLVPPLQRAIHRDIVFRADEAVVFQVQQGDLVALCIVLDTSVVKVGAPDRGGRAGRGGGFVRGREDLLEEWCDHEEVDGDEVEEPGEDGGSIGEHPIYNSNKNIK